MSSIMRRPLSFVFRGLFKYSRRKYTERLSYVPLELMCTNGHVRHPRSQSQEDILQSHVGCKGALAEGQDIHNSVTTEIEQSVASLGDRNLSLRGHNV